MSFTHLHTGNYKTHLDDVYLPLTGGGNVAGDITGERFHALGPSDSVFDGKVGIGVASPSHKLEVGGTISGISGMFTDRPSVNGSGVLLEGEIANAIWIENGSDIYYNDGNVGIGTSAPKTKFHVEGGITGYAITGSQMVIEGPLGELGIYSQHSQEGGHITLGGPTQVGSDSNWTIDSWEDELRIFTGAATYFSLHDYKLQLDNRAGTQVVQIGVDTDTYFNGGDVGIGTSAPEDKLHVNGDTLLDGTVRVSGGNDLVIYNGQITFDDGGSASDTIFSLGGLGNDIYPQSIGTINIGNRAGEGNDTSEYSVNIGYRAGVRNDSPNSVYVGFEAGEGGTGQSSTAVGHRAAEGGGGNESVSIGASAGASYTNGSQGVHVGNLAGFLSSGSKNTCMGYYAGGRINGLNNVYIGHNAGYISSEVHQNTAVGYEAGYSASGCEQNVFLGYRAGRDLHGSDRNVFVGWYATASSANSENITDSIILGHYSTINAQLDNVTVIGHDLVGSQPNTCILGNNQDVGIGTNAPTGKLHVVGSGVFENSSVTTSADPFDGAVIVLKNNSDGSWNTNTSLGGVIVSSDDTDGVVNRKVASITACHSLGNGQGLPDAGWRFRGTNNGTFIDFMGMGVGAAPGDEGYIAIPNETDIRFGGTDVLNGSHYVKMGFVGTAGGDLKFTLNNFSNNHVLFDGGNVKITDGKLGVLTTSPDADVHVLGGISGYAVSGDDVRAKRFKLEVNSGSAHTSHGTYTVDFNLGGMQELVASANMELAASNIEQGEQVQIRIKAETDVEISGGSLTAVGAFPYVVPSGLTGIMCFSCFGENQDDVIVNISSQQ